MDPRFPWLFPRLDGCQFGRGRSELLSCSYYYIIILIIKLQLLSRLCVSVVFTLISTRCYVFLSIYMIS